MTDSTPPEVLILQHVRPEPPGTIAEALKTDSETPTSGKIEVREPTWRLLL